jgi:hypothetical protein
MLIGAADGSTHYKKLSETSWEGPNGKVWEYNPLAPIVNPDAGMITVTGTSRQISRVSRYIDTLKATINRRGGMARANKFAVYMTNPAGQNLFTGGGGGIYP